MFWGKRETHARGEKGRECGREIETGGKGKGRFNLDSKSGERREHALIRQNLQGPVNRRNLEYQWLQESK